MLRKKKILWLSFGLIAVLLIVIIACDVTVSHNANGRVYADVQDIPKREIGQVLGTSPHWGDHYRNYYFENRIKAASDLYHASKVERLIVSGVDYRNNDC